MTRNYRPKWVGTKLQLLNLGLRKFLGHISEDDYLYHYQTLVDNVSLLNPKLLGKVNQLIVECGHTVVGKKPGEPLRGRCDSFVAETNVHYPTDVNLLKDAMHCMLRYAGRAGSKHEVPGWRQWKQLQVSLNRRFNLNSAVGARKYSVKLLMLIQ